MTEEPQIEKMAEALLHLMEEEVIGLPQNPQAITEMLKDVADRPEYAGVTVTYPGGLRFRLARAGGENLRFGNALANALRPYYLAVAGGVLSEEGALRALAETYAVAVVLEWEGGDLPEAGNAQAMATWLEANEVEFDDLRAVAEDPQNFLGRGRTYGDAGSVSTPDGNPGEEGGERQRVDSSEGSPRPRQAPGPSDAGGRGSSPIELAGGDQLGEPRNGKPRKRKRRHSPGRQRNRRGPTR